MPSTNPFGHKRRQDLCTGTRMGPVTCIAPIMASKECTSPNSTSRAQVPGGLKWLRDSPVRHQESAFVGCGGQQVIYARRGLPCAAQPKLDRCGRTGTPPDRHQPPAGSTASPGANSGRDRSTETAAHRICDAAILHEPDVRSGRRYRPRVIAVVW